MLHISRRVILGFLLLALIATACSAEETPELRAAATIPGAVEGESFQTPEKTPDEEEVEGVDLQGVFDQQGQFSRAVEDEILDALELPEIPAGDAPSGAAAAVAGAGLDHEPVACTAPVDDCLLYTSPSARDATLSRMPSSA